MANTTDAAMFDTYQTSLTNRYCSPEMSQLFSQRSRHSTWRKLWLFLAEAEKELGIETISEDALSQMREHLKVTDDEFGVAKVEEKKRRHDVMAHVHAYGQVAPAAAGIIHYGVSLQICCVKIPLLPTMLQFANMDSELMRCRQQAAM
ncbi:Adenylosuccinate lyase [Pyrenophora tritici-repentis]|nr:Adenylosuccinate lyase [Pyrenophora tritici-repentis]